LKLEESQRLAHGRARHAQILDHAVLGVELRAGPEAPAPDLAHELARDADGGAFGIPLPAHAVVVSTSSSRWRSDN
jgi:hypothetical protein